MKNWASVILFVLILSPIWGQANITIHKQQVVLMGSAFEICALNSDPKIADDAIKKAILEIVRVEELISSHKSTSETNRINNNAGIAPVKVSLELFELVKRSKKISRLTDGAFDISFAVMDHFWNFKGGQSIVPTHKQRDSLKVLINYENIVLNPKDTSVFLCKKGMRIGFGGIGKGYAANQSMMVMKRFGINSGYVDASGDVLFWGSKNGDPWKVGISDPANREKAMAWLHVNDMAVVTSGDYVHKVTLEGANLSHIIDPKSAWPVEKMRSVTILCADAELADGLATSVSVLGAIKGVELVNKLHGVECLIVTGDGKLVASQNANIIQKE